MGSSDALTRRLLYRCVPSPLSLWERLGVREAMPALGQRWLLTLGLLGCLCTIPGTASAQTWQEKTSTHFHG